jgi:hypothetical protein
MSRALATLTASGNLTPSQIQQLETQLRNGSVTPSNSPWDEQKKPSIQSVKEVKRNQRNNSPVRTQNGSPTSTGETSPSQRSAMLEEFRNNKNKKYELKVFKCITLGYCWFDC